MSMFEFRIRGMYAPNAEVYRGLRLVRIDDVDESWDMNQLLVEMFHHRQNGVQPR
jgi:hypothetical protein